MTWTALPTGQAVNLTPGYFYAVLANVKNSHSKADLESMASSKWGLTVTTYAEQGDGSALAGQLTPATDSNYKTVYAIAQATKSTSVPWSVASVVSSVGAWFAGDSSSMTQAWESPTDPSAAASSAESPTVSADAGTIVPTVAPTSTSSSPALMILAGVSLTAGLWMLWPRLRVLAEQV
jgi:hypothetical protein